MDYVPEKKRIKVDEDFKDLSSKQKCGKWAETNAGQTGSNDGIDNLKNSGDGKKNDPGTLDATQPDDHPDSGDAPSVNLKEGDEKTDVSGGDGACNGNGHDEVPKNDANDDEKASVSGDGFLASSPREIGDIKTGRGNQNLEPNLTFRISASELSASDIITTLCGAQNGDHADKILSNPPIKPKAGDVYLYRKKSEKDDRFLNDQYNGFRWVGKKKIQNRYHKTYYHMQLLAAANDKDGEKDGKKEGEKNGKASSSHPKRVPINFKRNTYVLLNPKEPMQPIVMIHYLGDESLYRDQPHGNARNNRPYIRTSTETKEKIKQLVNDRESAPKKVYEKIVKDHFKKEGGGIKSNVGPEVYELIDTPRDLAQVKNFKRNEAEKTRISKCEIFSVYEMACSDLETFVVALKLKPYFFVIVAEPKTLEIANQLLKLSKKKKELPQLIGYDTTFELADAYVSLLVMRNTLIHGNPIFPVAFMIHDRKLKEVHEEFWIEMRKHLDLTPLTAGVPICTDREVGIIAAINTVIPGANLVSCTNHIKRDIRFWLRSQSGANDADTSILIQNISVLLECNDITEYSELLESFKLKWSSEFRDYYEAHLENDITGSARFNVKRYAAFADFLPTNNLSESLNFVIKCHNKWKEVRIDTLVLKFVEIQCGILSEFIRATRNIGKYRIKEDHISLCKWTPPSYMHFSESEFASAVKASSRPEDLVVSDQILPKETYAKRCVELRMITNVPDQQLWIVRSPYNNETYHVHRNPTEKYPSSREFVCNCHSQSTCWHIIAVKLSIGDMVEVDSPVHKLSVVKKNNRGTKRRLGRKKPNPIELMANIEEAEDSELAVRKQIQQSFPDRSNSRDEHEEDEDSLFVFEDSALPFQGDTAKGRLRSPIRSPCLVLNRPEDQEDPVDVFEDAFQKECLFAMDDKVFLKHPTLNIGQWIEGSIIDGVINELMRQHAPGNMIYFGELLFQSVWIHRTATQIAQYSHQHFGLNKDIGLVCVSNGSHWMLGVIMLRAKTICLLDSLFKSTKLETRVPVFHCLWNIVKAVYATSTVKVLKSEWTFLYASDPPNQVDGTECGVIVCMMVYALLKQIQFPTQETLDKKKHLRNRLWMFNQLKTQENALVVKHRRLLPELKNYVSELNTNEVINTGEIQIGHCLQLIFDSMNGDAGRWTVCDISSCYGDSGHDDKQILCVVCRKWFHLTCLGKVHAQLPDYYICQACTSKNVP